MADLLGVFQFTPLREGRRKRKLLSVSMIAISIHAPPRGATGAARVMGLALVFQFTPLREGRRSRRLLGILESHFNSRPSARGDENDTARLPPMPYFNSRPSARGDDELEPDVSRATYISIHAPPRGATSAMGQVAVALQISIHAPPRGATAKDMQFLQIFCSTLTNQHGLTIVPGNLSRLFW